MIIELDLTRHENLKYLADTDRKDRLSDLLQGALAIANHIARDYMRKMPTPEELDDYKALQEEYPDGLPDYEELKVNIQKLEEKLGIPQKELMKQIEDAFTDYRGILSNHHSKAEAKAMEVLQRDANPMFATRYFTIGGKRISSEEFWGGMKPDVKGLLQSLLYAGRYLSHVDLVHYLMLGEYHLVENMQNEYIESLLQIQPALKYQKENGITIAKRIDGTGFFDLGDEAARKLANCPACKSPEWNDEMFSDIAFCPKCYGGGKIKKGW